MTRRLNINGDHVVELYTGGVGVGGIAKRLGISPRPVERVLREKGIPLRGRSEQQFARMARTTTEERRRLTDAAHHARRGTRSSEEELLRRAATRERTQSQASPYEEELHVILKQRGYDVRPQMAVGPYNIDLAIPPTAIEVLGGEWHNSDQRSHLLVKRTLYLCGRGWFVAMVMVNPDRGFTLNDALADQLIAYLDTARSDPTALVGQYRMFWGQHHDPVGGRPDTDGVSVVCPFRRHRDPTTGRYQRSF